MFGQISVGALKLENKTVQSRGLPAAICLSLGKSASAQQVLQEGHRSLFPSDVKVLSGKLQGPEDFWDD